MEIFIQYPLECLYVGLLLEFTWLLTWKPKLIYILGFPITHCLIGWGLWLYTSPSGTSTGEKGISIWSWIIWGGALLFYLRCIFLLPSNPKSASRRMEILQRRRFTRK